MIRRNEPTDRPTDHPRMEGQTLLQRCFAAPKKNPDKPKSNKSIGSKTPDQDQIHGVRCASHAFGSRRSGRAYGRTHSGLQLYEIDAFNSWT